MNKYDAWQEAPYHSQDLMDEKIEQRVCELLHGELNPDLFDNFQEAIIEEALYKHRDAIEEALQKNDKATLGLLVQSAVFTYWEDKATAQAQDEESNGDL